MGNVTSQLINKTLNENKDLDKLIFKQREKIEILKIEIIELNRLRESKKAFMSLKDALNKEYYVRGIQRGNETAMQGKIHLPMCLIGKKVKLKLVKD